MTLKRIIRGHKRKVFWISNANTYERDNNFSTALGEVKLLPELISKTTSVYTREKKTYLNIKANAVPYSIFAHIGYIKQINYLGLPTVVWRLGRGLLKLHFLF